VQNIWQLLDSKIFSALRLNKIFTINPSNPEVIGRQKTILV
jgi:hypothetical protein